MSKGAIIPKERRRYATQAEIDRALKAAKKAGMKPKGFEISPDGTIRILDGGDTEGAGSPPDDKYL